MGGGMSVDGADGEAMKLTYFSVMAKGLGPALVCELSGLPWQGPMDTGFTAEQWPKLKASGKCPFGQLPLLEVDGLNIGQCVAIVNYVGKKAGTEGKDLAEFAMSQTLIAQAEDLYNALQKVQPTIVQQLGTVGRDGFSKKGDLESLEKFWQEWAPNQLSMLEVLLGGKAAKVASPSDTAPPLLRAISNSSVETHDPLLRAIGNFITPAPRGATLKAVLGDRGAFTSTGQTVGELYLWAILHQMKLVKADVFSATPKLEAFYMALEQEPSVQKVLRGKSRFGPLQQYFVSPLEN